MQENGINISDPVLQNDLKRFESKMGYPCDIINPKTHNEHVMRSKYVNRDPLLTLTADKIRVKHYIDEVLGDNTLLSNRFTTYFIDDVKLAIQPPCVIKMNHGCGQNLFVFDDNYDWKVVKDTLATWALQRYGEPKGEWCYNGIVPGVTVEPLWTTGNHIVYRCLTFQGKVQFIHAHEYEFERRNDGRIRPHPISCSTFDTQWNLAPVKYKEYEYRDQPRPGNFGRMIDISEKLGRAFEFIRVDLFDLGNRIEFSEITHYPVSGKCRFYPYEFDLHLGSYWK